MVFTHIPSSILLILAAFSPNLYVALGLLLVRSALSQMDVPTRTSYVMAVVTPAERAAAASFTAVPRSLASAISPAFAGVLLTTPFTGLPLVVCGMLKIVYDVALLLLVPPHQAAGGTGGQFSSEVGIAVRVEKTHRNENLGGPVRIPSERGSSAGSSTTTGVRRGGIDHASLIAHMRPLRRLDFRRVGGRLSDWKGDFSFACTWYLAACAGQDHCLSGSLTAR